MIRKTAVRATMNVRMKPNKARRASRADSLHSQPLDSPLDSPLALLALASTHAL
jgi:hypothetical protein